MAIYTKQQFATLCFMSTKELAVYIGRGKVVLQGGKKCKCPKKQCNCTIDSEDQVNRLFIENNMISPESKVPKSNSRSTETTPEPDEKGGIYQLQKEKLSEQILELRNKNQLYEGKIQKIYEEIIPREHAAYLIKNYAIGIQDVWFTATERFLQQKATALGLSKEEVIEHKKYIREITNDAIRQGAENANKNIKLLAREFAGKKGRGERDDD